MVPGGFLLGSYSKGIFMSVIATATTAVAAGTAAYKAAQPAISVLEDAASKLFNVADATGNNSLTAYGKVGRISSRVYIDGSVAADPVITDICKTVITQYCGLILTAMQFNQFVSNGVTVQDLLRPVATEDMKPHHDIVASFGIDSDRLFVDGIQSAAGVNATNSKILANKQNQKPPVKKTEANPSVNGKISEDTNIPAGKVIELTLTNPNNPEHRITVNLLVQIAPYIVPEELAVQFIVKDNVPSFWQRYIQWKTGEISFWKDLIFWSDIAARRAKYLKLDPTGVFADMMGKQQQGRMRTMKNLAEDKNARARNVANTVLVFNQETLTRARAECGIDLSNFEARQTYFETTFSMMIVVVDAMYNHVTFYYNGIDDAATFSFDQMKSSSKGGNSTDLVAIMNALNQGKSPKF
jgi:hypothetical protein